VDDLPREGTVEERLARVFATLRAKDRLAAGVELEDLRRYFDVYWNNILAAHAYRPGTYDGTVTLFRALDDAVTREALAVDGTLGWGCHARGGVETLDVPGNHFNMAAAPHVQALSAALGRCLAGR
jgi:thioesterase domain-containing protein